MNVITLNNDQLAHVRSTLQKQANALMGDMNAAGESNWSELLTDLANDQHNLIQSIIAELDDCQTPKVVKRQPLQQQAVEWHTAKEVARLVGISEKTLRNRKQSGKLQKNKHWKKHGRSVSWNLATVHKFFSENSR